MARPRSDFLVCLGLCAITALAFHGLAGNGFVDFDDPEYVFRNELVRDGFTAEGVKRAFTEASNYNWHPVTWLSHMLDMSLFGQKPAGHHLHSLVLHMASACLLFLVLRRMVEAGERRRTAPRRRRRARKREPPEPGRPADAIDPLWPAAMVAALFAVHPAHVESVAWASERKDTLSTLFWMLTLAGYLRYGERATRSRYALVWVPFALGLLAKSMLATLPFVLLLLDYWPLRRLEASRAGLARVRPLLMEKVPLLMLSAAVMLVVTLAQWSEGGLASLTEIPASHRVANAVLSYVGYLKMLAWPVDLAAFYPFPEPDRLALLGSPVLAAAALLAVTGLTLRLGRTSPFLLVGWFWYLGTLIPVIGLVKLGTVAMADRYTYVPGIGIFIALVWGIAVAWPRHVGRTTALAAISAAVLLALVTLTSRQVGFWHDSEQLWLRALAVTEGNYTAHSNLAALWIQQDRSVEAAAQARRALEIRHDHAQAHHNLGTALAGIGDLGAAEDAFRRALALDADLVASRLALADTRRRRGNASAALELFEETLAREPHWLEVPGVRSSYRNALADEWREPGVGFQRAVDRYRAALRIDPAWLDVAENLAWVLASDPRAGAVEAEEAVALAGRVASAGRPRPERLDTLGVALAAAGRFDDAIAVAERAARGAAAGGDEERAMAIRARLELYRQGRPYRSRSGAPAGDAASPPF